MHGYPKAVMVSILVIDDDEQTRAFLRRVLEEAGYKVMEVPHNGQGPQGER